MVCPAFTCVGKLGFDAEMDVLISVSVWITVHLACWSSVATCWAKYWSTVCCMDLAGADGLVIAL